MRFATAFVSLLFVCLPAAAQHFHHHADASASEQFRRSPCDKTYAKPDLELKWQKVDWKVTGNETARKYFSQGMTHYYGFNFEEAVRNFRAALSEDPSMAMAAWGIALASGPNININMQGECAQQAVDRSIEADNLAKTQLGISDLERATISALRVRYERGLDPVAYAAAMRRAWTAPFTKNDPNVTAVYAESVMDLRPWGLFDNAHRPALDTNETIRALQDALKGKDDAVGPNHLLIHAVEAGPSPAMAQHAASILAGLVPESGHLVHMPSHINLLLGNYTAAVQNNEDAVNADKRNYEAACAADSFEKYWARPGCPAVYYGHYLGHNYFFQSVAAAFAGKSKVAIDSASATEAHVRRFVVNEPGLQRYLATPLMMLVAHQRWDQLPTTAADASCYAQSPFEAKEYWTGCHILRSVFFYAHAMANAWRGKAADARTVYALMTTEMKQIAPPTPTGWGNNTAAAVLAVPESLLVARIAWAENRKEESIEYLKLAVTREDAMVYDEPPQWFAPTREYLGGAYLQTGQFAKAVETFDDALGQHPKSGRALYGLMRACEKVTDKKCPADIKNQFEKAWKNTADYEMSVDKLW